MSDFLALIFFVFLVFMIISFIYDFFNSIKIRKKIKEASIYEERIIELLEIISKK